MRYSRLITLAIFAAAALFFTTVKSAPGPDLHGIEGPGDTLTLEYRIKALNIINGLYLDGDQMQDILGVLYDLEDMENRYREMVEPELAELERVYSNLEADLMDDDIVAEETYTAAGRRKHRIDNIRMQYMREKSALNSRLSDIFTDKQMQIVEDAEICVVPPKNSNNTRIGQSDGASDRAIEGLRRLRSMGWYQCRNVVKRMAEKQMARIEERYGLYTAEEKQREIARITEAATEAYEMDDLEFDIHKEEVAAQMRPEMPESFENSMEKRKKMAAEMNPDKKYDLNKLGRVFLNTALIDIFETKIAAAAGR